jgi:hypothetical protein
MIRMTLWQGQPSKSGAVTGAPVPDEASAEWGGELFSVRTPRGATMALARRLVAAGCPNQSWEAYDREGKRLLFGPNLHSLATWTYVEGDRPLKMVPHVERPVSATTGVISSGVGAPGDGLAPALDCSPS